MLRTALLTVSLCAASALFAFDAGAAPVTRFKQQLAVESYTTLVRDGCGRGIAVQQSPADLRRAIR